MSQIIPFEKGNIPARFAQMFPVEKLGTVSGGFPIISIKGKVFTRVSGDDSEVIKRPGEEDPASSINVIILKQNPADSKVYYKGNYTEGSDEKPLCYSNNGVSPEADSVEPQANKCSICPHNQWGSRISDNGGKGKACADSRRIAVAALGLINDPMLMRVPAASLKALGLYGDSLAKRQVPYQLAVTKIGFDYSVAHPALTFKAEGLVDEATADQIVSVLDEAVIDRILGLNQPVVAAPAAIAAPVSTAAPQAENKTVPAKIVVPTGPSPEEIAAKKAADAKAAKVAAAKAALAALEAEEESEPVATPVAEPVVEKAVKVKSSVITAEVSGDLVSEIEGALSGLDFDDEE